MGELRDGAPMPHAQGEQERDSQNVFGPGRRTAGRRRRAPGSAGIGPPFCWLLVIRRAVLFHRGEFRIRQDNGVMRRRSWSTPGRRHRGPACACPEVAAGSRPEGGQDAGD